MKSPVTGILGLSQALTDAQEIKPSEVAQMSGSMLTAAVRLYDLFDELLQWSLHRMSGSQPQLKPLPLKGLCEETSEFYFEVAQNRDIKIVISGDDVSALADAALLKTVLRSLISNAVKFAPSHSEITVSLESRDGEAAIVVADKGEGFTEELKKELFENPAKPTPGKTGETGTGLGLHLAAQFMKMQNGSLQLLEGQPNTAVQCTLRRADSA